MNITSGCCIYMHASHSLIHSPIGMRDRQPVRHTDRQKDNRQTNSIQTHDVQEKPQPDAYTIHSLYAIGDISAETLYDVIAL